MQLDGHPVHMSLYLDISLLGTYEYADIWILDTQTTQLFTGVFHLLTLLSIWSTFKCVSCLCGACVAMGSLDRPTFCAWGLNTGPERLASLSQVHCGDANCHQSSARLGKRRGCNSTVHPPKKLFKYLEEVAGIILL